MATEHEKARVTELHVRMDCQGCVQKIKKAMNSIDGVYDVYIDFPQQKLTVVGRADPEKIVKAIRKTRKTATICSHTEVAAEPAASDQPPAASDSATQPPPDNATPAPEVAPAAVESKAAELKDVGEIHMVHDYPQGYVYREHGNDNYYPPSGHEAPYCVTTHSYNSNRPSPYVTEYGYLRSPPLPDVRYNEAAASGNGYYNNRGGDGNQITSMFSDENPNACRIA